jgi:hypothetical protein
MATAKKTAVKTTAAKKTTTKKAVTKSTGPADRRARRTVTHTVGPSGPQVGEPAEGMLVSTPAEMEVAAEVVAGKWGSGRERDDALRQAGHRPAAVQMESAKLRAAAKPERERLPIPNSRKGSSWT